MAETEVLERVTKQLKEALNTIESTCIAKCDSAAENESLKSLHMKTLLCAGPIAQSPRACDLALLHQALCALRWLNDSPVRGSSAPLTARQMHVLFLNVARSAVDGLIRHYATMIIQECIRLYCPMKQLLTDERIQSIGLSLRVLDFQKAADENEDMKLVSLFQKWQSMYARVPHVDLSYEACLLFGILSHTRDFRFASLFLISLPQEQKSSSNIGFSVLSAIDSLFRYTPSSCDERLHPKKLNGMMILFSLLIRQDLWTNDPSFQKSLDLLVEEHREDMLLLKKDFLNHFIVHDVFFQNRSDDFHGLLECLRTALLGESANFHQSLVTKFSGACHSNNHSDFLEMTKTYSDILISEKLERVHSPFMCAKGLYTSGGKCDSYRFEEALCAYLKSDTNTLFIVGESGSGRSMCLRHGFKFSCMNFSESKLLPIYCPIGELREVHDIKELISNFFKRVNANPQPAIDEKCIQLEYLPVIFLHIRDYRQLSDILCIQKKLSSTRYKLVIASQVEGKKCENTQDITVQSLLCQFECAYFQLSYWSDDELMSSFTYEFTKKTGQINVDDMAAINFLKREIKFKRVVPLPAFVLASWKAIHSLYESPSIFMDKTEDPVEFAKFQKQTDYARWVMKRGQRFKDEEDGKHQIQPCLISCENFQDEVKSKSISFIGGKNRGQNTNYSKYNPSIESKSKKLFSYINQYIAHASLKKISESLSIDTENKIILLKLIDKCKEDMRFCFVTSNSLTILNYMGHCFHGLDMRKSVIKNADLSYGILENVNFEGSTIDRVNFNQSKIMSCTFDSSVMRDVIFGNSIYYNDHSERINKICVFQRSDLNKWVVSCGEDKCIKIYEVGTGMSLIHSVCMKASIRTAIIWVSRDKKPFLLCGRQDGFLDLLNLEDLQMVYSVESHHRCVNTISGVPIGQNENVAVTGGNDGIIRIWNVSNGNLISAIDIGLQQISQIHVFRNALHGICLAASCQDTFVHLIDFGNGQELERIPHQSLTVKSLCCIQVGRDNWWMISGLWNNEILVWDVGHSQEVYRLRGHQDSVTCLAPFIDTEGRIYLASCSRDETIRIWDLNSGFEEKCFYGHRTDVLCVEFFVNNEGNAYLVSGGADKTVRLWDISDIWLGGCPRSEKHAFYTTAATLVQRSENEISVAFSDKNRCIYLKNIPIRNSLEHNYSKRYVNHDHLCIHDKTVVGLLSKEVGLHERLLYILGTGGSLRVWDITNGYERREKRKTFASNNCFLVRSDSDSPWVVTIDIQQSIIIYDADKYNMLGRIYGNTHKVTSVCVVGGVDDSTMLLVGSYLGQITAWEMGSREFIVRVCDSYDAILRLCIVCMPDGRRGVAAHCSDRMVRIWDLGDWSITSRHELSQLRYNREGKVFLKHSVRENQQEATYLFSFLDLGDAFEVFGNNVLFHGGESVFVGCSVSSPIDATFSGVRGLDWFQTRAVFNRGGLCRPESIDDEFCVYCLNQTPSITQALYMSRFFGSAQRQPLSIPKWIDWLGRAFDIDTLTRLAKLGSQAAVEKIKYIVDRRLPPYDSTYQKAAFALAAILKNGWGTQPNQTQSHAYYAKAIRGDMAQK